MKDKKPSIKSIKIGSTIDALQAVFTRKPKVLFNDRIIIGNNTFFYKDNIIYAIERICPKCNTTFKVKNSDRLWDWCEKCKVHATPSLRDGCKTCSICNKKFNSLSKFHTRCPACHDKEIHVFTYKTPSRIN